MRRNFLTTSIARSFKRSLKALTRVAVRVGTKAAGKAVTRALRSAPSALVAKNVVRKARAPKVAGLQKGLAVGTAGGLRYQVFVPTGSARKERIPLLVMLHGCGQDAQSFAASTRMNAIAQREGFVVLYPEQSALANMQGCWNWFQTRTGKAQSEADAILAAMDQVGKRQAVDLQRVAVAGMSAGAGMAALLATRHPARFSSVAMHSGVAPGLAHSTATALGAMLGQRTALPLAASPGGAHLPALLVIQGQVDGTVAPANGARAALLWAVHEGALPTAPRRLQRGQRYAATVTDYFAKGRLVCTLCEIDRLGHAWSGGAAKEAYSDLRGPDASRMVWAFASRQFLKDADHTAQRLCNQKAIAA